MHQTEPLPEFRYYPDPVAGGSLVPSEDPCECCGRARGWLAVEKVVHESRLHVVCPWCIADGSAAKRWDAWFNTSCDGLDEDRGPTSVVFVGTDGQAVVGTAVPTPAGPGVPPEVIEAIFHRTPGFPTWQGGDWLFHCNDGCVFLGEVRGDDLLAEGDEGKIAAVLAVLNDFGPGWSRGDLSNIHPAGQPAVYLFRCRHCGTYRAFSDMT